MSEYGKAEIETLSDSCALLTKENAALRIRVEELEDKADGLDCDLFSAVSVAYRRGAVGWVKMNYPQWFDRIAKEAASGGETI